MLTSAGAFMMTTTSAFSFGMTETAVVVRVAGHATRESAPAFVDDVTSVIGCRTASGQALVVDMEDCEYLDSTFLGCLVILFRRCEARMSVRVSESNRERLFSSARIDRMIPVRHPDTVTLPDRWHEIADGSAFDPLELGKRVAEAHRCLADVEGPNAALYREVADRLDAELSDNRSKPR